MRSSSIEGHVSPARQRRRGLEGRLPGDRIFLAELVMNRDEALEKQGRLSGIPDLEADLVDRDGPVGDGKGACTGTAPYWI